MKKFAYIISSAAMVLSLVPMVTQAAPTTTPNPKAAAMAQCVKSATQKRVAAVKAATDTYKQAIKDATAARRTAFQNAKSLQGTARRDAITAAQKAYTAARKTALQTEQAAVKAAWTQFTQDKTTCKSA